MSWKTILNRLAGRYGYGIVKQGTIDTLRRESWLLRERTIELENLRRQHAIITAGQGELAKALDVPDPIEHSEGLYTPIYNFVGMRLDPRILNAHRFMKDLRFVAAYRRAVQAERIDNFTYWRIHIALWCAAHAMNLDGSFVECGVARGMISSAIMHYVDWNKTGRDFFLFDTFTGIDEAQLTDPELLKGHIAHFRKEYERDIYTETIANFSEFRNVHIVRGSVPSTLRRVGPICYLSIDMNNTAPEIAAASFFWSDMVSGAPILLDDYGFAGYEVQAEAFDAWAAERNVSVLSLPNGSGLILKP